MYRPRTALLLSALLLAALAAPLAAQETNVLAISDGATVVVEPPSYGPAVNLLDDAPATGWACDGGKVKGNVFVFELLSPATISTFEFDTAGIDGATRGAKDVTVEVSATSKDAGFAPALKATLADAKDGQRFAAQAKPEGRWVRLTIASNHGDAEWTELFGFRGFGTRRPEAASAADLSGTWATNYNDFHVRQQGSSLIGCYEFSEGTFEGSVEGRLVKLTWTEQEKKGPAVFVVAPDGKSFRGLWWHDTDKGRAPDGSWDGTFASKAVGGCPHWSGSVSGELKKALAATGRARLHGILFDTDSAKIRAASFPVLDQVVALLGSEKGLALTIEGHTDASGAAAHNQTLSEQRAKSVKEYLVGKGVDAARLATAGFGQTRPVADNATELGRAQNRRVELVRR